MKTLLDNSATAFGGAALLAFVVTVGVLLLRAAAATIRKLRGQPATHRTAGSAVLFLWSATFVALWMALLALGRMQETQNALAEFSEQLPERRQSIAELQKKVSTLEVSLEISRAHLEGIDLKLEKIERKTGDAP